MPNVNNNKYFNYAMTQKKSNIVIILIVGLVFFYTIILLLSDFDALSEGIHNFNYQFIPVILALEVIQIFLFTVKFHRLVKKLGINLAFSENLKIYFASLSVVFIPIGLGSTIQTQFLKSRSGASLASTFPLIFVELWTELLGILIITTILLVWVQFYESVIVLGIAYGFLVVSFMFISNFKTFNFVKKIIGKIKYFDRLTSNLDESKVSLNKIIKPKILLEATSISAVGKLPFIIMLYFIFLSFGVELEPLLPGQIYFTSLIVGHLSFLPGGLVVFETSMLGLLLKYNVEISIATLIIIFIRLSTKFFETIVGFITLKFVITKSN